MSAEANVPKGRRSPTLDYRGEDTLERRAKHNGDRLATQILAQQCRSVTPLPQAVEQG